MEAFQHQIKVTKNGKAEIKIWFSASSFEYAIRKIARIKGILEESGIEAKVDGNEPQKIDT